MKKLFVVIAVMLCVALCAACFACTDVPEGEAEKAAYTVMAPDGAPALALAKMMKDGSSVDGHNLNYSIIAASNVAATMSNGDADIIIAPTNAGAAQCFNTTDYLLLGATSWGNLYFVTTEDTYKTLDDSANAAAFLSQFAGASISTIGSNQVPDMSLNHVLTTAGVTATVVDGQSANLIQNDLIDGKVKLALLGEPAATATKAMLTKNGVTNGRILGSLAAVWQSVTGLGYPQASVFIKKSVAADSQFVVAFRTSLSNSIAYLNESAEHAEELGTYIEGRGDSTLKGAIVKQCYLRTAQRFVPAAECSEDVVNLVSVLMPKLAAKDFDAILYREAQ